MRESALAEAGDGIGGLGPELRLSSSAPGLAAGKPERTSCDSADSEDHLPFHPSTLAASDQLGPVRCRPMRRLLVALIAALLALAACGTPPASEPHPSGTAVDETTATTESPSPNTTDTTPGEVPEAQQFSLNDIAEFDDGLLIDIAGTVAQKANKTDRGAEATNGEIVIASVRIKNQTEEPYDAETVLIGAKYGDGKDAQIIIDQTEELQSGFTGKIKPEDEAIAAVGFAVPFKQLKNVTFIVDPNDDVHEAISFSGRVQRD